MTNPGTPLILASTSAARAALLRQAGLDFTAVASGVNEDAAKQTGLAPEALAAALAFQKAAAVSAKHPGALVIGADQVLVCEDARFDKPADLAAASDHLKKLRGRTHALVTAICVVQDGLRLWAHSETPRLTMRDISDAFIAAYLAAEGEDICGCAGAYKLEGRGIQLFEKIEGDFFTILGLPLLPLLGFLRAAGALA